MAESDFKELLYAAEQLSAEVEGSGELPKVERTLRQVLEASTELWSRVTQTGAQDIQAHLLLGSKGVDLPQLSQKLEGLSARKTFEPLEPFPDAHVNSFLQNELENAILSIIEENHKTSFDDSEKRLWEDIDRRWNRQKQLSLNSLLESSEEYLDMPMESESSVCADVTFGGGKSMLDDQEMAYAKIVTEYNKVIVQGAVRPSLVEKFLQVGDILHDKKVSELWEMVHYMVQVPPQAKGEPIVARLTPVVKHALISQAKKYFEDRYKMFMRRQVEGNLLQAQRGGVPGTIPLVASYMKLCGAAAMAGLEDGLVNGLPIWPMIYFCLRCGDVSAALSCSRQGGSAFDDFTAVLDELTKSSNRKLADRTEQALKFSYRRHVRNSTDPFKKVVYCILGACDVQDEHPEIAKTADDYLWLKLCQIREEENEDVTGVERMTLRHLQTLILEEYGEKYYNAYENPILYFQMLFLTGQFEAALGFLARIDKLRVHAVHIAIALHEHNLLSIPSEVQVPIVCVHPDDKPPARRLNLARLVMVYVRKFEVSDSREALQYYYLLRNLKSPEGPNLFLACVCDLVMEARNFDLVLGKLEPDGCRLPGYIDFFHGIQADVKEIIEMVAAEAERKGIFEDAIHLYDLANNHEKVLTLLSSLLCQVVHHMNKPGSLRSRLQDLAYSIIMRYEGMQLSCSPETASMFFTLRDLLLFFDQYHAQDYQQALETIARSKLIPLSMGEIEERVKNFRHLKDEICRCIPDVLLATMNILYELYKKVKGGEIGSLGGKFEDTSKDQHLQYLRAKAQAIISFAGAVPYHMPGDTNSRLVQIEIMMN
ncbi:nuclear pore complex protein Nup93 [Anabrus simplex]|uniref:nuclear pore complex protein Nup93 n=1 Tax=Anabrus simplex TaxID=316456 RepID=UPI0034DCE3D4